MSYQSARQRSALCALLIALFAAAPFGAQEPSKSPDNSRLIEAAKVWIAVKYFHPYLAYKPIDWDKALVNALPVIRAAKTSDEYASALESMLMAVHDPDTRVLRQDEGADLRWKETAAIAIHYGLPSEAGIDNGTFYSAFAIRQPAKNEVRDIAIPLSDGVRVNMRLCEPAESDSTPTVNAESYPAEPYPSTEYRILAAFKIGVVHHFFAYRDLMDEDWDDVFATFLPRFIAAKDAREYNLTISEMLTHTLDSNVSVASEELNQYFGVATVGLRLRLIEKKPVVTEILDGKATDVGLRVGDVVTRVDGDSIVQRFNRIQDYVSGGTPQRRGYDSLQRVLNGADGSTGLTHGHHA